MFRKSIHLCSAFVPLVLWWNKGVTLFLLGLALVIYTISEVLRLKGISVPLISFITKTAARDRDEGHFVLGPVMMATGVFLSALIFPLENATAGIFALAFGDGLASVGGKCFGKKKIPYTGGKTIAGSLTCWIAVFIATFIYIKNPIESLVLATAAMFIEALPLFDLDNLIIPLAIGALSLLF